MDILIDERFAGKCIRDVLRRELGFSANLTKKLKFSEDGIRVNGTWVTVRYELRPGDVLSLAVEDKPEDVSPYLLPADLPLDILYEDAFITAVSKPYNMPSHPSHGHRMDTVANALAYRYADRTYVFRPVNRLDRDTSGCMLTSNTRDAAYKMYTAMVEGRIHKTYLAVLDGKLPRPEGMLTACVRRKPDSIIEREICAPDADEAKIAVSVYRVLDVQNGHTLAAASPITGRTHQLRLHFAGEGCPITGDTLYGTGSPDIVRHALHSYRTTFPHPATGERMTATAPVPDDFASLLKAVGLCLPEDGREDLTDLIEACGKPNGNGEEEE